MSNIKYDDGSQEFFDDLTRKRIRKQQIDREISLPNKSIIAARRAMPVKEEMAKKAIEYYTKIAHISPQKNTVVVDDAALASKINMGLVESKRTTGGSLTIDEQMSQIPPHLRQKAAGIVNNISSGKNPYPQYNLLTETLRQNNPMQQFQGGGQQQQPQQINACRIMPGAPVFKSIETNGFGSTTVLVRGLGQADQRTASYQFIFREVVDAFIIPPNQQVLDLRLIESNPNLKTKLAAILAPQMATLGPGTPMGVILVPLDAIIREAGPGMPAYGNKNLLVDSRHGIQPTRSNNPPQIVRPNSGPMGRTILKG